MCATRRYTYTYTSTKRNRRAIDSRRVGRNKMGLFKMPPKRKVAQGHTRPQYFRYVLALSPPAGEQNVLDHFLLPWQKEPCISWPQKKDAVSFFFFFSTVPRKVSALTDFRDFIDEEFGRKPTKTLALQSSSKTNNLSYPFGYEPSPPKQKDKNLTRPHIFFFATPEIVLPMLKFCLFPPSLCSSCPSFVFKTALYT